MELWVAGRGEFFGQVLRGGDKWFGCWWGGPGHMDTPRGREDEGRGHKNQQLLQGKHKRNVNGAEKIDVHLFVIECSHSQQHIHTYQINGLENRFCKHFSLKRAL